MDPKPTQPEAPELYRPQDARQTELFRQTEELIDRMTETPAGMEVHEWLALIAAAYDNDKKLPCAARDCYMFYCLTSITPPDTVKYFDFPGLDSIVKAVQGLAEMYNVIKAESSDKDGSAAYALELMTRINNAPQTIREIYLQEAQRVVNAGKLEVGIGGALQSKIDQYRT